MFLGRLLYTAIPHGRGGSPYATLHYAVWCVGECGARHVRGAVRCFDSRGARGAVFRDAGGQRTARGARGGCGAVFRDTLDISMLTEFKSSSG